MNYKKLYYRFCEKFKHQDIDPNGYYEKHHIVPRHQGGTNDAANLVCVTLRQHIFLHKLRWYAYKQAGDRIAYLWRSGQTEAARIASTERLRELLTGTKLSSEFKAKLKQIHKKRMEDPASLDKIRKTQLKSAKAKSEKTALYSQWVVDNAERNEDWLVEKSNRSFYKFVSPEGLVFDSPIFAANYYGNEVKHITIENWCKRAKYGWTTIPELAKK